ncbi:MAG: hypothetical protein OXD42_09525, partial [Rhodospirillaceae bacterium]|nr:hypothetical protein [Rhodospirillaceae bacterium]
ARNAKRVASRIAVYLGFARVNTLAPRSCASTTTAFSLSDRRTVCLLLGNPDTTRARHIESPILNLVVWPAIA